VIRIGTEGVQKHAFLQGVSGTSISAQSQVVRVNAAGKLGTATSASIGKSANPTSIDRKLSKLRAEAKRQQRELRQQRTELRQLREQVATGRLNTPGLQPGEIELCSAVMAFKVTCTGKISGSARAKLGKKGIKVVRGGSGPSGQRYTLRPVKARDPETAVRKAKAAVEAAGGFCSFYTASDDY
jgi:hypothetical protein